MDVAINPHLVFKKKQQEYRSLDHKYAFPARILDATSYYEHVYLFTNNNYDNSEITIISFDNSKPCCGDVVNLPRQTLQPGKSLELAVRIKPSQGHINHIATLKTNNPIQPTHRFITTGLFYPPYEIRNAMSNPVYKIKPNESKKIDMLALAYSYKNEDRKKQLESLKIHSASTAKWLSDTITSTAIDGDIVQWSRPFSILPQPKTNRNEIESEQVTIALDGEVVGSEIITYRVLLPYKAVPDGIFINKKNPNASHIIIKNNQNAPFRIDEIDFPSGVVIEIVDNDSSSTKTILISFKENFNLLKRDQKIALTVSTQTSVDIVNIPIIIAMPQSY